MFRSKRLFFKFSKYKRFNKAVEKISFKDNQLSKEPFVNFKPFLNSVYKHYNDIQPLGENSFNLTKPDDVPDFLHESPNNIQYKFKSPEGAKLLRAILVGCTNSGKSLVMNRLVQRHVSAVSNKSFTTNIPITGINTDVDSKT